MQPPLAVDVREAGRLLSVAPRTVRAWVKSGRIRCARLGRRVVIPVSELERLLAPVAADTIHLETKTPACEAGEIETRRGEN